MRIECRSCGNQCLPPGGEGVYLCPRCRQPLTADPVASLRHFALRALLGKLFYTERRAQRAERLPKGALGRRAAGAVCVARRTAAWIGGVLAPVACVFLVLLLMHRAMVTSATPRLSPPQVIVPIQPQPYSPKVERNYLFRIRQLQSDLASDPREYALFARLGLLHLRLATHTLDPAKQSERYAKARHYFSRAAEHARTRREYDWALAQRESCSNRVPVFDAFDGVLRPDLLASAPPPSPAVEEQLQLRAQFLEMRVEEQPESARLLCRLGLTYVRLAQAIVARERRGEEAAPGLSPVRAADCRRRAWELLREALRQARSREIRVECHLAIAEFHRAGDDPLAALGALRRALELQPNHWPAQLQAAALLNRLGRPEAAQRHRELAERWRTPEWL